MSLLQDRPGIAHEREIPRVPSPTLRAAERQVPSTELTIDLRDSSDRSPSRSKLIVKRLLDLTGALVALLILSPVLLITAIAVALSSPGPVFFVQERVGHFGRPFRMLKFRSMCHDAEDLKHEITELNVHEAGPIFKIPDDPRLTRVGKVIRRLSIDELPQLLHVVSGKMSLVGPRPPLPSEVEHYSLYQMRRLLMKPGITCIWQVSGRSEVDFDTWVEMDISYIENWTLSLDVKLLARTIPAVLSGRGAY